MSAAQSAPLSRASILRVAAALIAAERIHHGSGHAWDDAGWTENTVFGNDGLALDSLERLACSAEVSRFFRLHEAGADKILSRAETLGAWCDIVQAAHAAADGFTFATSGTTGLPKLCRQSMATLHTEATHWSQRFAGRARVVQTIPAHHIYGFIFSVLLPQITGWPVLDARMLNPVALRHMLLPTDLLVATPTQLALLLRGASDLPHGLAIVSATASLDEHTHAALYAHGAAIVADIYGSSETAAIGVRTTPGGAFHLLPRWQRTGSETTLLDSPTGEQIALPDHVVWETDRTLRTSGRIDGAVQVAGVNVYPHRVAASLRTHPMVADCTVRLNTALCEPRLLAVIVPTPGHDPTTVATTCDTWSRRKFTAPERPVTFEVVPVLP